MCCKATGRKAMAEGQENDGDKRGGCECSCPARPQGDDYPQHQSSCRSLPLPTLVSIDDCVAAQPAGHAHPSVPLPPHLITKRDCCKRNSPVLRSYFCRPKRMGSPLSPASRLSLRMQRVTPPPQTAFCADGKNQNRCGCSPAATSDGAARVRCPDRRCARRAWPAGTASGWR